MECESQHDDCITPSATLVINNTDKDESTNSKRIHRLFPQITSTIITSWLSLIAGYASAYSSPAEPSIIQDLQTTTEEISWITSFLPVGALTGSLSGGPLIEHLGRKKALITTTFINLASWLINYFAKNYWNLYLSRFLCGFAVGITSFALPVYLAEIVQPKIRGRLGILPTLFGNFGILLCFSLGNLIQWRGLAATGILLTLPLLILIWIIPESPRWYISKNRIDKARNSLQYLRGKNHNIDKEIKELLYNIENRRKNQRNKDKLCTKLHLKALSIVLALMFFQQFSGISALIFYMTTIFRELKTSINESISSTLVGTINFLTTFIAGFFVDKLGRKFLLYLSFIFLSITLALLGFYFYCLKVLQTNLDEFQWAPLVLFMIYVLAFSLGLGPIPWLMMGEILPATVRGTAASISTAVNFGCAFLVTKSFPILEELIGSHYVFWIFSIVMVIATVYLKYFVPETKKRTLEDIENILANRHLS